MKGKKIAGRLRNSCIGQIKSDASVKTIWGTQRKC